MKIFKPFSSFLDVGIIYQFRAFFSDPSHSILIHCQSERGIHFIGPLTPDVELKYPIIPRYFSETNGFKTSVETTVSITRQNEVASQITFSSSTLPRVDSLKIHSINHFEERGSWPWSLSFALVPPSPKKKTKPGIFSGASFPRGLTNGKINTYGSKLH